MLGMILRILLGQNAALRVSRMRMVRLPVSEERRWLFVTLRRAIGNAVWIGMIQRGYWQRGGLL